MLMGPRETARRRRHCPSERDACGRVSSFSSSSDTSRVTDKRHEHNVIWKSCCSPWWTPVYVRKNYKFEVFTAHQHVKSFLYLCTLIAQSGLGIQSFIKLVYEVLVFAKYFTYRIQDYSTDKKIFT